MSKDDPIEHERQLDSNRTIAQKIRNRLNQLVNANEKDKQRWVWELLQNAKDTVTDKKVDIEIKLSANSLKFKHNGGYFSPRNVANLVNQLSSKEGTNSIGRFGTGFLTTHTLSRLVKVSSVYVHEDLHYSFEMMLDRRGSTEEELIQGLQNSWDSRTTKDLEPVDTYWTSFDYIEPNIQLALDTINDFEASIFYALAFIENIGKVIIKNEIDQVESEFCFKKRQDYTGEISVLKFKCRKNNDSKDIYILYANNGDNLELAIELEEFNSRYRIKPIPSNVPRLFCAFPLVGTENFSFPLIINSTEFVPKTERDGLYLQGDGDAEKNKELLQQSLELYQEVLNFVSENQWFDLYVLAYNDLPPKNDDFDQSWYKNIIQNQIRQSLLTVPIVETLAGDWVFISKNNDEDECAYFPYDKNEKIREQIWKFTSLLFTNIPKKEHVHYWYKILWSEDNGIRQTLEELASDISRNIKSIDELSSYTNENESDAFKWLNSVITFFESENPKLLDKYTIFPDQYGIFKLKNTLRIDKDIPNKLKDILHIVNVDLRETLLHQSINKAEIKGSLIAKSISDYIDSYIDKDNQLTIDKNGNYLINEKIIYSESEYLDYQEKTKNLVFKLIGYSGVKTIDPDHKKIWEFSRALYYEDIPSNIEILSVSDELNLHQKSLKWLIKNISNYISKLGDIETLGTSLYGHIEAMEWLNNFISFIQDNENYKNIIDLDKIPLLPNQDGIFHSRNFLFQDNDIDPVLKEILKPLNPNWISELLDTRISGVDLPQDRVRNLEDIAKEIDETFRRYFESHNTQDSNFISSFQSLDSWLSKQKNPHKTNDKYFNWIYRNKAELALSILGDNEEKKAVFEIIQSGQLHNFAEIAKIYSSEDIEDLMTKPEQIRQILSDRNNDFVSVTNTSAININEYISLDSLSEELGGKISSVEDIKRLIKEEAKNLIKQDQPLEFKPEPVTPTRKVDFEAIAKSNEEAKSKVRKSLESKSEYDLTGWYEESNTIIGGVKRQGINIKLVIKGADHGIIHFDRANKERRILKQPFTELWVYHKGRIVLVTIGKILEDENLLKG